MRRLDVPVLIVGAGPAGLTAALLLERLGIESLVVERRPGPQRAPAAHVVNARTFEICRAAGVDMEAVARAAIRPEDGGFVYWVEKLGGREIGRLPFEQQGPDQLELTPTPLRNLSQNRFEPLLLSALESQGGRAPSWSHQWESAERVPDGVLSRIRDRDSDDELRVQSRYLLAADGAGSRIRKWLGIEVEGPDRIQSFIMVHFRTSLRERIGTPPGVLLFVCDPRSGGGVFVVHDLDSEAVFMTPFDPEQEAFESYDAERCAELIRAALEDPSLEFQVETISSWAMTAQVAARYRADEVFLVGDAAHRFPPTGGLGLNTGVQDVHNLAWKLAAVLKGEADPALLDSYERERRPVAKDNAEQSLGNAMRLFEVPQALGITDASEASCARMHATLADPEGRRRVEAAVANQAEHFDMPGLQLGFAYPGGGEASSDFERRSLDPRHYEPSGAPGCRLPHAWVGPGAPGESLLDWVPDGRFLLLAGPEGEGWVEAAAALADAPLTARAIPKDGLPELDRWLRAAGLEPDGALLVRPDQHVAWRAPTSVVDPRAAIEGALRAALYRADA